MSIWNEPIEVRRLWREGYIWRTPYSTVSCLVCGRVMVLLGIVVMTAFVAAMLAFEVLMFVHDPWLALGCWAVVGAIALVLMFLKRRKGTHPDDPDEPTDGTGVPVPRVPAPAGRSGRNAEDLPNRRRRVG